jgi:hypothetical protein
MWYYTLNDQQAGPISQDELSQMLQSILPADTLVWKDGMSDWVVANTLAEFSSLTTSSPPAVSPPTLPAATSNPYSAPTASSYQNYQAGDYPLPKVKKANFGLLTALILLGTLTMIGGYGAMIVNVIQNSSNDSEHYQDETSERIRLEPIGAEEASNETETVSETETETVSETVSENETTEEINIPADNQDISETQLSPMGDQYTNYSIIGFLGIVIIAAGGLLGLVYVHRAWQLLQPTQTTITPGQAVGFMFIPLFNLYWMFIAYHKWAVEWNNTCRRHPSLTYAPKGSEGAFLAMAICYCASIVLSFLGILSSAVLYIIGMKSMCDAINFAAENGEAPNQPFR